MKNSRMVSTVLVFLIVVVVALAFSPKAVADTVLSESTDDWSLVLQPDGSGNMVRLIFYGRIKPAHKYKDLKNWSESGALDIDFAMPKFLTYFAGDKLVAVSTAGYPITLPIVCSVIPRNDETTKGELIRCELWSFMDMGGQDIETMKSGMASSGDNIGFLTAENWGDGPLEIAVSALIDNSEDSDGDYVPNAVDICADVKNYSQEDSDLDGVGDACVPEPTEVDTDGDGVPDSIDECINEAGDPPFGCPPSADTSEVTQSGGPSWAAGEEGCSLIAR